MRMQRVEAGQSESRRQESGGMDVVTEETEES